MAMAAALTAEARLLAAAGIILLALGFPLTLTLAWFAMTAGGAISPLAPALIGGMPLLVGYIACELASRRYARAKMLAPKRGGKRKAAADRVAA